MTELAEKKCTPCQGGIPPLPEEEAKALLEKTPGWTLLEDGKKIERKWTFKNWAESFAFLSKVSELVEDEGHHPDVKVGWGYCEIQFYTHKIGGLHENDFIIAAKVNELAESMDARPAD